MRFITLIAAAAFTPLAFSAALAAEDEKSDMISNGHGGYNTSLPRRSNSDSLFGEHSVFSKTEEVTVNQPVPGHPGRTRQVKVRREKKVDDSFEIRPEVESNGHGAQVTVYKKYIIRPKSE